MNRKNQDKGRLPPFVPLFKETLASPAWRRLSHGAKALYVALKVSYIPSNHNNGRIYLSHRDARKELRSGTSEIARWYRELQHYGFIVQTRGGSLGVDGRGFAPHWRLTECGYMRDEPTKDFLQWDGKTKFKNTVRARRQKTESRTRKLVRGVPENRYIRENQNPGTPEAASVPENRYIGEPQRCTRKRVRN